MRDVHTYGAVWGVVWHEEISTSVEEVRFICIQSI